MALALHPVIVQGHCLAARHIERLLWLCYNGPG